MNAMNRISFALVLLACTLASTQSSAQSYATIYDHDTLVAAYHTYAENLRGTWAEDFIGSLQPEEAQVANTVRFELPLEGRARVPYDFYADPTGRRVVIPILSVKFFDDIATALAWFESRDCETGAVQDYVGMTRYQHPGHLPDARFPSPLEAFRIPDDVFDNQFVYDTSGKMLKSGLFFVMAHEFAHVLKGHRPYDALSAQAAQAQEIEADRFALSVLRRIAVPPVGILLYFTMLSRTEQAPGDFDRIEDYETYMQHHATHPLTSRRLLEAAAYMEREAASFASLQTRPAEWIDRIRAMARSIAQTGRNLDDPQMREYLAQRSLSTSLDLLASACR